MNSRVKPPRKWSADRHREKPWQPLQRATVVPKTPDQLIEMFDACKRIAPQLTDDQIWGSISKAHGDSVWLNDIYQVHVIRWPGHGPEGTDIIQLSIKRIDQTPARDWRHFQAIKDQLVGPECEGVELYPAQSGLVDTANQYHVWVIENPRFRWPVGYTSRMVNDESIGGSVQRPHPSTGDNDASKG